MRGTRNEVWVKRGQKGERETTVGLEQIWYRKKGAGIKGKRVVQYNALALV
jgi:hypothetical protein